MNSKVENRICKHHGKQEFAREKVGKGFGYRCKVCRSNRATDRRRQIKSDLVKSRGGGCEICGYNRSVRALHFHHLNPSLKQFGLATSIRRPYSLILEEAAKCILLCSNCHAEVEDGLISCVKAVNLATP